MKQGRWVDPVRSWHETNVTSCEVCGRLIPRRSWVFEGVAGEIAACSPDCEDLYTDYVISTYEGANADHQG